MATKAQDQKPSPSLASIIKENKKSKQEAIVVGDAGELQSLIEDLKKQRKDNSIFGK